MTVLDVLEPNAVTKAEIKAARELHRSEEVVASIAEIMQPLGLDVRSQIVSAFVTSACSC